jgi:predicted membrane protein
MQPDSQGSRSGVRITPQMILGIMVIAFGVLMTLDNLGHLDAGRYVGFWPLGLIAIGLAKMGQTRTGAGGALGGLILVAAGTWLVLEQAGVVRISIWELWPALLVAAGGFLVWQGLSRPGARRLAESNETLNAVAILGGVTRGSNSPAFRGGELTAIMGGCEIDLRRAAIDGEAVLEVFAMWGGIEVRVPDDWVVVMRVTALLAGAEDSTRPPQGATRHRLVVQGMALMGGVEIKN